MWLFIEKVYNFDCHNLNYRAPLLSYGFVEIPN